MTRRDANAGALLELFDFDSPPRVDVPDFPEPAIDEGRLDACRAAFP
jgi:hypothetical protein